MTTQVQTEQTTRAIVQDRYRSPDVLTLNDVPRPAPDPGQVPGGSKRPLATHVTGT